MRYLFKFISVCLCFAFIGQELLPYNIGSIRSAFADPALPSDLQKEIPQGFKPADGTDPEDQKKKKIDEKNAIQEGVVYPNPPAKETDYTVILPDGTIQYYHDKKLVRQVSKDGRTVLKFDYDDKGNLKTLTKTEGSDVTVYDFATQTATQTFTNGEKKVYKFEVNKHPKNVTTDNTIARETLFSWEDQNFTYELKGYLQEHTLADGTVLTYNEKGQLIKYAANDEHKTIFQFEYGQDGKFSKITKTYGDSPDGVKNETVFDFATMTAVQNQNGKVTVYKFELRVRNSMMGIADRDLSPNEIVLGTWTVSIPRMSIRGGDMIYTLVGVLQQDPAIPPQLQDYANHLQQLLGSGYAVTIAKDDTYGFVIRIMANPLPRGVYNFPKQGLFQEMRLILNAQGMPVVISASYAGFEKNTNVSLLQGALEQLAGDAAKTLLAITQIKLTSTTTNRVTFIYEEVEYVALRDKDGRITVEKFSPIPPAIQAYGDQLQAQLGAGFVVSVVSSASDPNKYTVTINRGITKLVAIKGSFESLTFTLVIHTGPLAPPSIEGVEISFAGYPNLDTELLLEGMSEAIGNGGAVPSLGVGTLVELTKVTITSASDGTSGNTAIRFRYNNENYQVSKDSGGNVVVVKQTFDNQGRVIKESSLDGKNATYYAFGTDFTVVIKFENGVFTNAVKNFTNGRTETYDHLREVNIGDVQPLPDTPPAIGPDEVVLWSSGRPGDLFILVIVGMLKTVKYPSGTLDVVDYFENGRRVKQVQIYGDGSIVVFEFAYSSDGKLVKVKKSFTDPGHVNAPVLVIDLMNMTALETFKDGSRRSYHILRFGSDAAPADLAKKELEIADWLESADNPQHVRVISDFPQIIETILPDFDVQTPNQNGVQGAHMVKSDNVLRVTGNSASSAVTFEFDFTKPSQVTEYAGFGGVHVYDSSSANYVLDIQSMINFLNDGFAQTGNQALKQTADYLKTLIPALVIIQGGGIHIEIGSDKATFKVDVQSYSFDFAAGVITLFNSALGTTQTFRLGDEPDPQGTLYAWGYERTLASLYDYADQLVLFTTSPDQVVQLQKLKEQIKTTYPALHFGYSLQSIVNKGFIVQTDNRIRYDLNSGYVGQTYILDLATGRLFHAIGGYGNWIEPGAASYQSSLSVFISAMKEAKAQVQTILGFVTDPNSAAYYTERVNGFDQMIDSAQKFIPPAEISPLILDWFIQNQNAHGTGLIVSHPDEQGFIYNDGNQIFANTQAYTYDQAIAAITLLKAGNVAAAKKIFDFFYAELQKDNGNFSGFWTVYNVNPNEQWKRYEWRKGLGENAWIALFCLQYQSAVTDPAEKEKALGVASAVAKWISTLAHHEGGVAMSPDNPSGNPNFGRIYSVENNLDYYALLKALIPLTSSGADKQLFMNEFSNLKNWLKNKAYDSASGIFKTGGRLEGNGQFSWDPNKSLDVNAWAVQVIGTETLANEFGVDLNQLMTNIALNFAVQEDGSFGGNILTAKGFDFSDAGNAARIGRTGMKWVEGTNQMILTYRLVSDYYTSLNDSLQSNYYKNLADHFENRNLENAILVNGTLSYIYADHAGVQVFSGTPSWRTFPGQAAPSTAWVYFSSNKINPFDIS